MKEEFSSPNVKDHRPLGGNDEQVTPEMSRQDATETEESGSGASSCCASGRPDGWVDNENFILGCWFDNASRSDVQEVEELLHKFEEHYQCPIDIQVSFSRNKNVNKSR